LAESLSYLTFLALCFCTGLSPYSECIRGWSCHNGVTTHTCRPCYGNSICINKWNLQRCILAYMFLWKRIITQL